MRVAPVCSAALVVAARKLPLVIALAGMTAVGATSPRLPSSGAVRSISEERQLVTLTLPDGAAGGESRGQSTPEQPRMTTAGRKSETILLAESFEASWPVAPWRVTHPAAATDVVWGKSGYRASQGSSSIWCAGSGAEAPGEGGQVPAGTESWAIVGPYDLSTTTSASLTFDLWLETEAFHDPLMWLVSTDGVAFRGEATSTNTAGWKRIWVDLSGHDDLDVTGEPHVWIAFVYRSDHSVEHEGAYLDNLTLLADSGGLTGGGVTYRDSEDFAQGTAVGLDYGSNALTLASAWSALPFIWVPSPPTGTVSRLDIASGAELARYRTGPQLELEPSPVAVDLEGSCWVGNRAAGSVVKIGLESAGACVDRNDDGAVDTSRDEDGDGSITGAELLAWGEDECVLLEVLLVAGEEAVFRPGESHEGYARTDLQALAVDADDNVWVGVSVSGRGYKLDGSSGAILQSLDLSDSEMHPSALAIDRQGDLWWSSWPDLRVLWVDPTTGEQASVDLPHGSRNLALDQDQHLLVTGFSDGALSRVDTSSREVAWTVPVAWQANGLALTSGGEVWVAAPGSGTVARYVVADGRSNGSLSLLTEPTGLAVDGAGEIWVAGSGSSVVQRVNPALNLVDLEKDIVATAGHDTAGDLTGIVARTVTTRYGTWTVVQDSGEADTLWGTISWQGSQPEGTETKVRVRSSADRESWSAWEEATNGVALSAIPSGRFLQVEVALKLRSGETSPVLEELTVTPTFIVVPPLADFTWTPSTPVAGETVLFTDHSSGGPTSWAWDFGDGATSGQRNPTHVYAQPGGYTVVLEVDNEAGSDSESKQLVVAIDSSCQLDCAVTVPTTAVVDEPVHFLGSATSSGCSGQVAYAWSFGDDATSGEQSPTHGYAASGTYHWEMTATVADAFCTRSGDVVVSAEEPECTWQYWVPVVSHAPGALASVWRSDLGLLGSGSERASVVLRLHGSGDLAARTLGVDPGEMADLEDVVHWVDPGVDGSGALEVCANGALAVTSRTYNQLADNAECLAGGSFGQSFAGVASSTGLAAGDQVLLPQLRENAAFRTNLGFTNTGSQAASLTVGLFDAAGTPLVAFPVDLEPGQWLQDLRPFRARAGREDLDAGWARVEVLSGSGVFAYASVVDNVTNDPTTVPMQRPGGGR